MATPTQKTRKMAKKSRRLSTLPHSLPCSTIDAKELDFRVRDGIGYGLFAIITGKIEKAILKYMCLFQIVAFELPPL